MKRVEGEDIKSGCTHIKRAEGEDIKKRLYPHKKRGGGRHKNNRKENFCVRLLYLLYEHRS